MHRGRYFGTAVHNACLQRDATYSKFINNTHEFGQLVAEASMKWDQIQPKRVVFTFEKGDEIADLAKANGQLLRCHANIWHI